MKRQTKKKEGRVKNATPNEYDGIKFRSKLETYTYKKLKEANIEAEYEKHRFDLLPAFIFNEQKIRAITYLPDFVGFGFIIECKGFPNEAWPLREKLFKYYLSNSMPNFKFYVVHTQKEVDAMIKEIKQNIQHGEFDN